MKAGSNLERILENGRFAVTAELGPPRGASGRLIETKGELLRASC
ncbi:MAG: methylenetetrahydrofolate reductase, partial [Thermoplasmata archaeon]|nr:methylenetetrahydrofolate reductase [Thermoplasmata archaeon]NIY04419.1 methylenetetrahydrofolate reductase [Thermoplasmata archaeon]